jgi:hypothetical protein
MFGFIGRVLIYIAPIVLWFYLNQKLDTLEGKKLSLKQHRVWGKFYWIYGWAIGVKKFGTVLRYFLTGIGLVLILRWFFILTSTTPR